MRRAFKSLWVFMKTVQPFRAPTAFTAREGMLGVGYARVAPTELRVFLVLGRTSYGLRWVP